MQRWIHTALQNCRGGSILSFKCQKHMIIVMLMANMKIKGVLYALSSAFPELWCSLFFPGFTVLWTVTFPKFTNTYS